MKWRAARIGDRVYDLSHLHPFSFDFVVAAKDGKPEQRYGIDVIFSLHCFSRGIPAGAAYLADLAYADSREVRLFDEQRYTRIRCGSPRSFARLETAGAFIPATTTFSPSS